MKIFHSASGVLLHPAILEEKCFQSNSNISINLLNSISNSSILILCDAGFSKSKVTKCLWYDYVL